MATWPISSDSNNKVDQFNFFPYGEGLVDFGLAVGYALNGNGLVTRGLVWQGRDIWGPAVGPITTTWTSSQSAIVTVWASSQTAITTTWTPTWTNEYPVLLS